jgi:CDP-diacylglycerol--glycerol-3-phosphate 3-phosphatidyltransferase
LGSLPLAILYLVAWSAVGWSDALDGKLARRYGGSPRGATIDEMSDKLTVWLALIALVAFGRVAVWFAVIMIARDVAMTALRMWMRYRGSEAVTGAKWSGKVKTTLQFVLIVTAFSPWFGSPSQLLNTLLAATATVVSVGSFLQVLYVALAVSAPTRRWSAFKDQSGNIVDVNDGSDGQPIKLGVPNWLTIVRASIELVVPPYLLIFQPFGLEVSTVAALVVAVMAMLTDLFDGVAARHYAQATEFGTMFDPIADKVSIYLFAFGLLIATQWTLGVGVAWLAGCGVVILLRDALTLPAVLILKGYTISMPRPLFIDKLRAALLMVLVAVICLGVAVPVADQAVKWLLAIAAVVSASSVLANTYRFARLRLQLSKKTPPN